MELSSMEVHLDLGCAYGDTVSYVVVRSCHAAPVMQESNCGCKPHGAHGELLTSTYCSSCSSMSHTCSSIR